MKENLCVMMKYDFYLMFLVEIFTMTSPAINGQKDNGNKAESSSTVATAEETTPATPQQASVATPPLVAWWRIFKLVNLLQQQGC